MTPVNRLASSILLAAGTVLVFAGLSAALGFTVVGMLASIGVITALLYAGGIWFAPAAKGRVLVFDTTLTLTSGGSLLAQFPAEQQADVRARCLAVFAGERARFQAGGRAYHATPLASADGTILYGALIEDHAAATAWPATAPSGGQFVRN